MSGFFKKLGEAVDETVKEIEKISKKPSKKPPKDQEAPSKGHKIPKILSVAEVARISKLPFDRVNDHFDDLWEGVVYTSSNPKIHITFQTCFARKDPESDDATGVWGYLTEMMPNPQPVKRMGEEAFWFTDTLYVRTGKDVLYAGGGLPQNIITKLAKIILEKSGLANS